MVGAAAALPHLLYLVVAFAATPRDNEDLALRRLGDAAPDEVAADGRSRRAAHRGARHGHAAHGHSLVAAGQDLGKHVDVAQTRKGSRLRSHAKSKASAADVESAHKMLNGMLEQFVQKKDMQQIACGEVEEKQSAMLEQARRDLGEYNTQGALARARVLSAQIAIASAEEKLPKLMDALALHKSKCNDDSNSLHQQMTLINQDAGTLESVMGMSSCSTSAAASLLECTRPSEGLSFITFGRRVLRRKVAQLRTDTARRALHKALAESMQTHRMGLSKRRARQKGKRGHRHKKHAKNSRARRPQAGAAATSLVSVASSHSTASARAPRAPQAAREAQMGAFDTIKESGYPSAACSAKFTELGGPDAATAEACAAAALREGAIVFAHNANPRKPGCFLYPDLSGPCADSQWDPSPEDTTYMLVTEATTSQAAQAAPTSTTAAQASAFDVIKASGYPSAACSNQYNELSGSDAASAEACAAAAQREGAVVFAFNANPRQPACYLYPDLTGPCADGQWDSSPEDTTYQLVLEASTSPTAQATLAPPTTVHPAFAFDVIKEMGYPSATCSSEYTELQGPDAASIDACAAAAQREGAKVFSFNTNPRQPGCYLYPDLTEPCADGQWDASPEDTTYELMEEVKAAQGAAAQATTTAQPFEFDVIKEKGYPSAACASQFEDLMGPEAASPEACAAAAHREGAKVFALNAHPLTPTCFLYPDLTGPCDDGQWDPSMEDTTYILYVAPSGSNTVNSSNGSNSPSSSSSSNASVAAVAANTSNTSSTSSSSNSSNSSKALNATTSQAPAFEFDVIKEKGYPGPACSSETIELKGIDAESPEACAAAAQREGATVFALNQHPYTPMCFLYPDLAEPCDDGQWLGSLEDTTYMLFPATGASQSGDNSQAPSASNTSSSSQVANASANGTNMTSEAGSVTNKTASTSKGKEVLPWDWRPRNQKKCALRENADCGTLQDKLLLMQMGITDKIDYLKNDISKAGSMCEVAQGNYRAQIDDLQRRLEDQQAALAEATKVVVEAQEQSRLMSQQLAQLQIEGRGTAHHCESSLQDLDAQICSMKQIREELYTVDSGDAPFIQDCEVSAWTPEECTAECGGGVQNMSRAVVAPQSGGAACPPLMMQRRCNEQPCPIDCSLEEWGGWSACSAGCGGGIMERVRGIKEQPKHGGKPCGTTFESQSCNGEACDLECVLSDWSEWSGCSKECDAGFMQRSRKLLKEARGQGGCPAPDSLARLEYMHCNTQACKPKHGSTLRCITKLDVVLLLDGSGSVSTEGWEATTKVGNMLVDALLAADTGTKVAVLLYSGPTSWNGYQKCVNGETSVDLSADCNMQWASHFTSDSSALSSAISGLKWPKGTSMTAAALTTAAAELHSGSEDGREQVVIVITDGKHMSPYKTMQAATSLREKARLMWVPATEHASISDIKSLASTPIASNVVALRNFSMLAEVSTVNRIIADACRDVE